MVPRTILHLTHETLEDARTRFGSMKGPPGYSADDLRGGIPDITKNVKNTAALAEELSVGDIAEVKVLEVDPEKKRIALTMKGI